MPFRALRWRMAIWNLVILSLVLGTTIAAVAVTEFAELHVQQQDGSRSLEDEAELFAILVAGGVGGLVLAGASSVFLADRAMRPIREAFERQRRFIADASHELRTPVAVVRARAEVLERQAPDLPAAVREEVQQLCREAEELSVLLDELLDLARLDGQQVEPALEAIALAEVAEEIVGQLRPLAESRGVHLEAQVAFVWGRASLTHLRQVVRALTDNALKYTPAGGHVVVGVAHEGDWACITVADTGPGIPPQHLPRVFEPFYHADSARRRGLSGAGLGLTIAAQLVRLMHGRLLLDSTLDSGTTAKVLLPLARSVPSAPREAELRPQRSQ